MSSKMRSWLFVPGDSDKKIEKSKDSDADVLIFDLEDSVAPSQKAAARTKLNAHLTRNVPDQQRNQYWVRINPLDTNMLADDLVAIMPGKPDGIVLPKANGSAEVTILAAQLSALETKYGYVEGNTKVMVIATETAKAAFTLGDYANDKSDRLAAMTWGAEDLSSALGASTKFDAHGNLAFTYQMVRSLTLLGAHAAELTAIDGVYTDFRDSDGLAASCRAARAEGFHGRLAIHPAQVDIINEAFTPAAAEIEFAQRVVDAFAADPDAGVIALDGKMLDIPHLKQAQNILAITSDS